MLYTFLQQVPVGFDDEWKKSYLYQAATQILIVYHYRQVLKELRNCILCILCAWLLNFSMQIYKSEISTYSLKKLVFGLSVFYVFCIFCFKQDVKFGGFLCNVCVIIVYIVTNKVSYYQWI